jgi:hypothetical protein
MYYVFTPALHSWENEIMQAKIQGNIPEYRPHYWDCKPLVEPLPSLTFAINRSAPLLDNYFTGTEFELFSNRLVKYLQEAGVHFESFSTTIIDRNTKREIPVDYKVFHLLELHSGLDEKHSDIRNNQMEVRKLVLTEECLQNKRPFFRLKGMENLVLIYEDLKSFFDNLGITGCEYIPVDEYKVGIELFNF